MYGNGNGYKWWWPFKGGHSARSDDDRAAYRRLALQLHYDLPRPDNSRSVLLVTPAPSSLCAYGSAVLASCLAEELGGPILLIDVSPNDPEVSRLLECMPGRGFVDFLSNPKLPLDDLVLPTTCQNVSFLPAGIVRGGSHPAPIEDISALLKEAESRYEFVVLSGGSVLNYSPSLDLAPHIGCVLLLVVEKETRVEDLDSAQEVLGLCKARKVGLVLTTPARSERWSF